jgi:predicted esterase
MHRPSGHENMNSADPHDGQRVYAAGPKPEGAAGFLVMMHGRGASAQDILSLYYALKVDRILALAPQAAGNVWYPRSFLAPLDENQPYLDSALNQIESTIGYLLQTGISSENIALLGFSQGACLVSEYVARHPRRYGGVMALTCGLIGPPGTPRHYPGSLGGTPVFLGTSDPDPHVPVERVEETQQVLEKMGAEVDLRTYPGMPHTVNDEELGVCREMLLHIVERK